MTPILFADITIFVLTLLVGFQTITKVPATLHTPLMSGSNAIHGVIVVGVMILAASANTPLGYVLVFLAAVFAAMNVVGGYVVTDRMLEMFTVHTHPTAQAPSAADTTPDPATDPVSKPASKQTAGAR